MQGPGGRTRSVKVNGATYDLGAQWVGPPHKYARELAKRAKN
jgi:phytoene dehydrogenase-like protein